MSRDVLSTRDRISLDRITFEGMVLGREKQLLCIKAFGYREDQPWESARLRVQPPISLPLNSSWPVQVNNSLPSIAELLPVTAYRLRSVGTPLPIYILRRNSFSTPYKPPTVRKHPFCYPTVTRPSATTAIQGKEGHMQSYDP